MYNIEHYICI